jgi:pimeloyl-ACP methyl ester carboxylesterase
MMLKTKFIFLSIIALIFFICITLWIVYEIKDVEIKNMDGTARKNASGKFASLSGGITHYDEAGADTAKTIILVHGFSVPYYIWDNIYDSLVHQGFHVVKYDEFGRGYSDRPDVKYVPELYRQQLFDLINSLKIKTPVALAGVSFGGAVVTDFAVHHPEMVNKIILVDPVYERTTESTPDFMINYVMTFQHEKRAKGQLDDFKYPNNYPDWVDKYKVQMQYKGFRHALISTLKNFGGGTIINNYKSLDSLHKNILLIWGREDHTVPFNFSDSLRSILHVHFFPVDDAAHLPYIEQAAVVSPQIISFLKE